MTCTKHPGVSGTGALCPVCLLEQALDPAVAGDVIVQMPLGQGAGTSVYLVREDAPAAALLRLKVWERPAPASFLDAVAELSAALEDVAEPSVVPPRAAFIDAAGHPAVLSVFRQGLPITGSVESGALDAEAARALLEPLAAAVRRCHRAGLAHGAMTAGNVLVEPDGRAAFLVDFGLALLFDPRPHADAAAADHAGLAALGRALSAPGA